MSNLLVQNIKHTNNTTAMSIDTAGRVTTPARPSWSAYTTSHIESSQTIVFDTVVHNIGSHYNSSNGKFTAPVTAYKDRRNGTTGYVVQVLSTTTKKMLFYNNLIPAKVAQCQELELLLQ